MLWRVLTDKIGKIQVSRFNDLSDHSGSDVFERWVYIWEYCWYIGNIVNISNSINLNLLIICLQHDVRDNEFYILFVTVQSVFQQRNIVHQTDAVSLLPLRCFPLFFFSLPVTTAQLFARVEITVFSKSIKLNVKLIHTSGLEYVFPDMK